MIRTGSMRKSVTTDKHELASVYELVVVRLRRYELISRRIFIKSRSDAPTNCRRYH